MAASEDTKRQWCEPDKGEAIWERKTKEKANEKGR